MVDPALIPDDLSDLLGQALLGATGLAYSGQYADVPYVWTAPCWFVSRTWDRRQETIYAGLFGNLYKYPNIYTATLLTAAVVPGYDRAGSIALRTRALAQARAFFRTPAGKNLNGYCQQVGEPLSVKSMAEGPIVSWLQKAFIGATALISVYEGIVPG